MKTVELTDQQVKDLRTLVDHELQQVKDAHLEGDIGWDEEIFVRKTLFDFETMTSIMSANAHFYSGDQRMTLRVYRARLQDLRRVLRD